MAVNFLIWFRRFRAAAWLGWQVESNWTDPFLFTLYTLAKPLATGLILLVMYLVVIGGSTSDPRLAWMYVGNAYFAFVPLLLVGFGWAVVEDREMYQMLKYVYVAPIGLFTFLAGRSLTKLGLSVLACGALLVFGALVLRLGYHPTWTSLIYGAVAFPFGVLAIYGLGLILAGFGLVFARHSVNLNEGAAAILYLLCGAIFPLDLLPPVFHAVGLALPMTWWLEAMRRSLGIVGEPGVLSGFGQGGILGILVVSSVVWYGIGVVVYGLLERRAKQLGMIDQTTNF
jgi:ABC-2 type transport system permease protein